MPNELKGALCGTFVNVIYNLIICKDAHNKRALLRKTVPQLAAPLFEPFLVCVLCFLNM